MCVCVCVCVCGAPSYNGSMSVLIKSSKFYEDVLVTMECSQ